MITTVSNAASQGKTSLLNSTHVQARLDRMQDDDSHLDLIPDEPQTEIPEVYLAEADYQVGVAERTAEGVLAMLEEALRNARASADVGRAAIIGYAVDQVRQIVGSTRRAVTELQNARELIREQSAS